MDIYGEIILAFLRLVGQVMWVDDGFGRVKWKSEISFDDTFVLAYVHRVKNIKLSRKSEYLTLELPYRSEMYI